MAKIPHKYDKLLYESVLEECLNCGERQFKYTRMSGRNSLMKNRLLDSLKHDVFRSIIDKKVRRRYREIARKLGLKMKTSGEPASTCQQRADTPNTRVKELKELLPVILRAYRRGLRDAARNRQMVPVQKVIRHPREEFTVCRGNTDPRVISAATEDIAIRGPDDPKSRPRHARERSERQDSGSQAPSASGVSAATEDTASRGPDDPPPKSRPRQPKKRIAKELHFVPTEDERSSDEDPYFLSASERMYRVPCSDPARPKQYLKPIKFDESVAKGGLYDTIPSDDLIFQQCFGKTLEKNRVLEIVQHQTALQPMFYVVFEMVDPETKEHKKNWVHFKTVKILEPKHVLVDYIRSVYLFHPARWKWLKKKLEKYGYDEFITDDLKKLREEVVKEQVRQHSKTYYNKQHKKE